MTELWRILIKTYKGRLYYRHFRVCERCLTQYTQIQEVREIPTNRAFKTAEYIIQANHDQYNNI